MSSSLGVLQSRFSEPSIYFLVFAHSYLVNVPLTIKLTPYRGVQAAGLTNYLVAALDVDTSALLAGLQVQCFAAPIKTFGHKGTSMLTNF